MFMIFYDLELNFHEMLHVHYVVKTSVNFFRENSVTIFFFIQKKKGVIIF